MNSVVVDTAVAVKWYVPEEHSDVAAELLDPDHELHVPDLLFTEFGNVLWRKVRQDELIDREARAIAAALLTVPLRVHESRLLLPSALEIAMELDRSVYDSAFLALAVILNATLLTTDQRLINSLQGTLLASHVQHVTDWKS